MTGFFVNVILSKFYTCFQSTMLPRAAMHVKDRNLKKNSDEDNNNNNNNNNYNNNSNNLFTFSSGGFSSWKGQYYRHFPKQPRLPDRFLSLIHI